MKIGFIGTGAIALHHLSAIEALGASVVLASARSEESKRWQSFSKRTPGVRFEKDAGSILLSSEVDAVVACLPWDVTESWLLKFLCTEKPVLIEKPISLSSSAIKEVLSNKDVKLANKIVGFNRRYYETVQKLRQRVGEGGLAAVEITVSETVQRLSEKYGENIIPHVVSYSSSHILDTANFVFGKLSVQTLQRQAVARYQGKFSCVFGMLRTEKGIPVMLSIHADSPVLAGIRAYFEDDTVWHLSPLERLSAYSGFDIIEPSAECNVRRYIPKPIFETSVDASIKPGFLGQMRAFVTGEGLSDAATVSDSLGLMEFIEELGA